MKRYDKGYYKAKNKERYEYMKRVGLCSCGERAEPGKVCCIRCSQIKAARYENMTEEEKERRREYMREYMKKYNKSPKYKAKKRTYGLVYKGEWK